jgi:hypothetical protein
VRREKRVSRKEWGERVEGRVNGRNSMRIGDGVEGRGGYNASVTLVALLIGMYIV